MAEGKGPFTVVVGGKCGCQFCKNLPAATPLRKLARGKEAK